MKDIKTKPLNTGVPKIKPKIPENVRSNAHTVKEVMKDKLARQMAEAKISDNEEKRQAERADIQATEGVEDAVHSTADTVYQKSKDYTKRKLKNAVSEKIKARKSYQHNNANMPKTSASVAKTAGNAPDIKTKENYIKQHTQNAEIHSPKAADKKVYKLKNTDGKYSSQKIKENIKTNGTTKNVPADTPKQQAKKYVKTKLEAKRQAEKSLQQNIPADVKPISSTAVSDTGGFQIKTKESYIKSQGKSIAPSTENPYMPKFKSEYISNSIKTKSDTVSTEARTAVNKAKQLKTKQTAASVKNAKNTFKQGYTVKKKAVKANKAALKTQKEITKKAAKQAAKQAKAAAQRTAQVAKATAKTTAKIAVKVAQVIAHAVKALVSAIVALGGWVVLLVVLIIIIIVAAIAASPFGIFISDEAADKNSIPISSIVAECNMELSQRLTEIEDAAAPDRVVMEGEQANWSEVLAVFSVKVAGTDDDTAQEVVVITTDKKQKLKDIFWKMNSVSSRTETKTKADGTAETVLYITLNHKTKDDMINEYHFTPRQQEALATLLENNDVLVGATQSLAISDATAQEVLHSLPDSLSQDRKNVIKAACSLVGKVNYFWGGKSSSIGWDSNWGKMTLVTAEGSRSSGSMRPFGLDCSGFVTWCFINSGKTGNAIGYGTKGQIAKCTRVSWSIAEPGDLAFLSDLSHVGIVAGRDSSGNILIIHCSSGANNVVITSNGVFGFAARPSCY